MSGIIDRILDEEMNRRMEAAQQEFEDRQAKKAAKARLRAIRHMLSDDWDGEVTDDFAHLKPEDFLIRMMGEMLQRLESIDNRLKALTES